MTAPAPQASLLLVDDHPPDLVTLEAVLEPLGHRLVHASSGAEALELASREEFAVVLIDARMPGLDGFATAERLRQTERGRATPLIFLSAHDKDKPGILRAYDLGAVDYVTKPFEHALLRAKVQAFVDLYFARRRAREQAERAEARERALLDRFLERAPACLAIFEGPEHRFVFANACFRAMAGGRKLLGVRARQALPELGGSGFFERLDRVYGSGEPDAGADAPTRWVGPGAAGGADVSFTHHPYGGADGRTVGIMTFGFDVTDLVRARRQAEGLADELAKSEGRFRSFVESIPLLAWSARADGSFDYCNSRWYAYTGATPEATQGWGWASVLHPARAGELLAAWRRAVDEGADFEAETLVRGADGADRWFLVRAVPVRDEAGRVVRWFGTGTNIDDRKRVEAEREALLAREHEARGLAEEAGRAKDEFLATISHELRTPLNAILGWARLLRGGAGSPAQLERAFEVIERNALAQAKLVDDLLDVSRLASGRVRLKRERVTLAAAARDALDTLAPAAEAKRLSLEVRVEDEGEVMGDADRLQQIAWNLVSNAVKFSPAGAAVRVVVRREGGDVELSVEDGGPGIPPALLPHVFDPFRQADGSITRLHGGLGLGLSIARQFAELHGGTIAAASGGEGAGAAFTVRLPAAPRGEAPKEAAAAEGAAGASLQGVRALVVDDEPDACDLTRLILERAGAEVVTALDAGAALRALLAWAPDVLVSDVGMPGTDGYAFVRRVRRLSDRVASRTPAVALTAFVRAEDRVRALEAGFDAYVPKPVDPAELTLVVASAARPRQQR
ncbi:MAG TPA: response regulator [Polyangiaceae bacterium]|nr:response regulator [Polyangiaceae bacterium]